MNSHAQSSQILQFHPSLEGPQRRKLLKALIRLAQPNYMVPNVYRLRDIEIGDIDFQSSGIDIFRGIYRRRVVCLKKCRAFKPADRDEMAQV